MRDDFVYLLPIFTFRDSCSLKSSRSLVLQKQHLGILASILQSDNPQPSTCPSPSIHWSIHLLTHPSIQVPISTSICLVMHLLTHESIHSSTQLPICTSMCLYIPNLYLHLLPTFVGGSLKSRQGYCHVLKLWAFGFLESCLLNN